MRKPAELAPSRNSCTAFAATERSNCRNPMRELQRRWRNTVRIDEKLYAPDEMLDRAVWTTKAKKSASSRDCSVSSAPTRASLSPPACECRWNSAWMNKSAFPSPHSLEHGSVWMKWFSHEPSRRSCSCLRTSRSTAWKKSELLPYGTIALRAVMLMTGGQVGEFTLARVA